VGYDVTVNNPSMIPMLMLKLLLGVFKKVVFQLERGTEGTEHYQIRGHLTQKRKLKSMITEFKAGGGPIKTIGGHWSITSGGVHTGNNFNYIMKDETRVDGPWTEKDYEEPPVLTRQLTEFHQLVKYPWQSQIEMLCEQTDNRSINIIYDVAGNSGKSILAEALEYDGKAFELPPMNNMEDIMQFVFSFKSQKVYLIDMPRAMKKDKLCQFYSGIECLKNGVCYDKRYAAKKRRFDRPQIIVFSNCLPDWQFMSPDRWVVWEMTPGKTLKRYDPTREESEAEWLESDEETQEFVVLPDEVE